MKIVPTAIAATLLLTACSKMPSDAAIRQKIPGFWTPDFDPYVTWKIEADGHLVELHKLSEGEPQTEWTKDGNWGVTNRIFFLRQQITSSQVLRFIRSVIESFI